MINELPVTEPRCWFTRVCDKLHILYAEFSVVLPRFLLDFLSEIRSNGKSAKSRP